MNKQNGFTIIELLIVMAIIGILVTLIVVGYGSTQNTVTKPCSEYGNYDVSDVPARCADYFNINAQ